MKLVKLPNSSIHNKTAYRLIVGDDEAFEIVRSDDPNLKRDRKQLHQPDPDVLMYVSTDRVSLNGIPIGGLGEGSRPIPVKQVKKYYEIGEKTINLNKLIDDKKV